MQSPGDSVTVDFAVTAPTTGALTNADSTPAGKLVQNGSDDTSVTVTVTNKSTGRYKASFTIPSTYQIGDDVDLVVTYAVGGVSLGRVFWRASLE